jgi:pimeloyl-ACP methyl ester carboxylesterase
MAMARPTGRATTPDGVGIAYYELGGSGPPLLLAHATGFCGAVFGPLAARLADRYRCVAFDERAHGNSDRPGGDDFGWYGFAADVLAVVDELGLERPGGVGHSCGAAAVLLAEQARPGTFESLYCYEPILWPGDDPRALGPEGNPLAAGALRRREVFGSRAEALQNFSTRGPFDRLHPEVLAAYVDNGFGPGPDGIRLRCRRDDEAQVYGHAMAHDTFAQLGRVRCPVTLACGAETDAVGPEVLGLLAERIAVGRVEVLEGIGHFGPLEDPDALAASVAASMIDLGDTAPA